MKSASLNKLYSPVNRFRKRRGLALRGQIKELAALLGRDIRILDVGGRPDYWANVGLENIARIELVNVDPAELGRTYSGEAPEGLFQQKLGNACDLKDYPDQSVDLVHSNSVIEHVGDWRAMRAMASELMRVGRAGWVQTPAWEFPIEPHFRLPFGHWFGKPAEARMMSLSLDPRIRGMNRERRRREVEKINLLSKGEVRELFPGREMRVERVILAKSYVMRWMPARETAAVPAPVAAAAEAGVEAGPGAGSDPGKAQAAA